LKYLESEKNINSNQIKTKEIAVDAVAVLPAAAHFIWIISMKNISLNMPDMLLNRY